MDLYCLVVVLDRKVNIFGTLASYAVPVGDSQVVLSHAPVLWKCLACIDLYCLVVVVNCKFNVLGSPPTDTVTVGDCQVVLSHAPVLWECLACVGFQGLLKVVYGLLDISQLV